jgi:PIN domain nuclease of toxin-antitoxin system
MKLLLDTCSLIWLVQQPERHGSACHRAFADPRNDLFVSAISLWEMSIKSSMRRLKLENATVESFITMAEAHGCQWIGLQPDVAGSFYRLPIVGDHRDPFDRMLVSGKPSTQTSSSRQETGRWQPMSLMGWS